MPYTTTSLADLQTLMVQRWDQTVFWTGEEARLALNETLREWNLLTGRWRTRVPVSAFALNPEVQLPGSMTYGMRVTTSLGLPLTPTSLSELDLGRPSWRQEHTASGGSVPTRPLLFAPVSLTRLAVWPAASLTASLVCDGVLATPVLIVGSDVVDLGEEIIDVVVDMALHVAAFKEAAHRWRATRPYFDVFLAAAAEENSLLKTHQRYRRFAGLDRRRDYQPATGDPSQMQGVSLQFASHARSISGTPGADGSSDG